MNLSDKARNIYIFIIVLSVFIFCSLFIQDSYKQFREISDRLDNIEGNIELLNNEIIVLKETASETDAKIGEINETLIDKIDTEIDNYIADMNEIAEKSPGEVVLTDAMKLGVDKPVIDLIKGDQKSVSIAAASILAKVTRDRIMEMYDGLYPEYGFAKNKGYPTKAHLDAIDRYGIVKIHRKSFGPVRARQLKFDF